MVKMIDVLIYCKGHKPRRQRLAAMPHAGDHLLHDGRLWRVDSVVFHEASATWGTRPVSIYAIAVNNDRREELERQWAEWDAKPQAQY